MYATGYRSADPAELLGGVAGSLRRDAAGQVLIGRDYRLSTTGDFRCGIYVQGATEATHGIASHPAVHGGGPRGRDRPVHHRRPARPGPHRRNQGRGREQGLKCTSVRCTARTATASSWRSCTTTRWPWSSPRTRASRWPPTRRCCSGTGPDGADAEAVAAGTVPLAGSTLIGHMNVENPQWRRMRSGDRALIVFQGPHGYVSPTVYDVTPAAPTWNSTAVHVTGTVEPTAEPADVLDIVSDTARRLEGRFGRGWDQESSLDYFRQIAPGVGAFTLRVESVQTMFKLSQGEAHADAAARGRAVRSKRVRHPPRAGGHDARPRTHRRRRGAGDSRMTQGSSRRPGLDSAL